MEQYHVAAADGQTPLVMSGGHVVMQALSGQMSSGQTLQSPAGQVNLKWWWVFTAFAEVLLPSLFGKLTDCLRLMILVLSQCVSSEAVLMSAHKTLIFSW